jgi:RNA polymerase primary sigma factor
VRLTLKISKQFTSRESQSLDKYLQEIGKVDLLTADQEIELAKKIKKGDRQALEMLAKANLRFVVSVAKQYQNQGLSLGDLINEGNLGLIKAAKRFDETRGFKFISYAVWWIRQSILQALAEQSRIVRLPLNRVGALKKIGRAYSNLEQEFEREPSATELATELDMDIREVSETLRISGRHVSVDAPFAQGEDNRLIDIIQNDAQPTPDYTLMAESLKSEIGRALASLPERESEVIKLYFGLNKEHSLTLEEIGEKFNLTRERVRQIKEKAIRRLRHTSRSKSLRTYLG